MIISLYEKYDLTNYLIENLNFYREEVKRIMTNNPSLKEIRRDELILIKHYKHDD